MPEPSVCLSGASGVWHIVTQQLNRPGVRTLVTESAQRSWSSACGGDQPWAVRVPEKPTES